MRKRLVFLILFIYLSVVFPIRLSSAQEKLESETEEEIDLIVDETTERLRDGLFGSLHLLENDRRHLLLVECRAHL